MASLGEAIDLFQTHSLRVVIVIIFTRVINVDFLKFANYKKLLQVKGNKLFSYKGKLAVQQNCLSRWHIAVTMWMS